MRLDLYQPLGWDNTACEMARGNVPPNNSLELHTSKGVLGTCWVQIAQLRWTYIWSTCWVDRNSKMSGSDISKSAFCPRTNYLTRNGWESEASRIEVD